MIAQLERFQESRKNAVAIANAKESQQYKTIHQQVKPSDQHQLKSFNQLRQSAEQPDGDAFNQLKSTAEQKVDGDKQLKSSAEQQEETSRQADELKAIEELLGERNGDVKIHMDAPPDKMEAKEEEEEEEEVKSKESKIKIEDAADDDEEAMEALLSRDMRETEIR